MQGRPKPARAFTTTASEREREQAQRDQLRAQQARVETVEKFSGLRIRNRLVASMVVEDKFSDLRFFRLGDLRHDIDTRWATVGVLLEKQTRAGANGGFSRSRAPGRSCHANTCSRVYGRRLC